MSRPALAALFALLLAVDGALWSAAFARGDVHSAQLALYPERLDGQEIVLTLVDVLTVGEGSYRVKDGRFEYTILGDPSGLSAGMEIYVGGTFQAEGRIVDEAWREPAPDRFAKKVLGFLGIALTGLGIPLWFRIRRDGVALHG